MNPIRIDAFRQLTIPDIKDKTLDVGAGSESFGDLLKTFVKDVNEKQMNAVDAEKKFLNGEISDVHQVMIAAEEASVAFELLMEIRNKLLDSYREIIRTPA